MKQCQVHGLTWNNLGKNCIGTPKLLYPIVLPKQRHQHINGCENKGVENINKTNDYNDKQTRLEKMKGVKEC